MRRVGMVVGAVVLLALALSPAFAAQQPFADVPQDHWAYDAIAQLAQQGVLEGYPDGTFKGKRNMTRYEFAVAIARIMESIQTTGTPGPAGPQGPVGPPGPAGTGGLTAEQQALLDRLANEFAPELRSLRSDLEDLTKRVAALEGRVEPAPRVTVSGVVDYRVGVYGTKLSLSEDKLSTGYPAFLNDPAYGNIAIPVSPGVVALLPISDGLKDAFKANRFSSIRTRVNLSAALSENSSAMVGLLAGPTTSLINPERSSSFATSPAAFSGNGVLDTVQVDQAWLKYGTKFITPMELVVGKQYLQRGVGLLFDNDQQAIPALRADFGSGAFRLGAFLGMLDPNAFFGRTAPAPIGLDQFGNALGMYGLGAAQVSSLGMYQNGQDMYNLFYADFEVVPGWRIGGNFLDSGFRQEEGWSASLTGSVFGLGLYGEYAKITQWPTGVDFADVNGNGIKELGEGDISESDTAWLAGLKWANPWLSINGEYGRVDAGYAFAPTFGGWDAVGDGGFFNMPLSALHPRAEIDPHDINWVDRPLFLDPTNIAKGWHVALAFPTLLGEGNSLAVSYADGDAYTPEFLGWLFGGASGTRPTEFRDADPFWTVKLARQMSDSVTMSLLYGRRNADNVLSPQTFVTNNGNLATNDDVQVIRGEVAVAF